MADGEVGLNAQYVLPRVELVTKFVIEHVLIL